MSMGAAADLVILVGLAVVLGLVVWLIVQQRRAKHGPVVRSPAPQSADGSVSPSPVEVEPLAALIAERASAAEQALGAAQALLAEQAAAAERNTARAQALAVAETEAVAAREAVREQRLDLDGREQRLSVREQRVEADAARVQGDVLRVAQESARLEQRSHGLVELETRLVARQAAVDEAEAERVRMLERVAGLTADEARSELVAAVETQAKRAAAASVRAIEREAEREADTRARRIVTLAVQRVASEQTAESVVTVLHLPSDDMKGRIIGREGRNIRAFEAITGVNLIIDDTPEAVVLSCFDPVRREIGRLTLESLVLDGRIHPHRIEEVYERSQG